MVDREPPLQLGAGAPEINQPMALQRCGNLSRPSQPTLPGSDEGPMVAVVVGASVLQLPERVLSVGASALQIASGEHVRLLDYADSAGPFLAALERQGLIAVVKRNASDRRSTKGMI